ncbi:hypothetical protein BD626DRAFT_510289 [Schizophyllum amplum]|uniref:Uncharacterized protein n=1 Tax=Schizophyllum amplum TaxID=97359 RepID=A0A550C1M4_9AGAR|nr:hypothetical protein BD626DRAFT_510289 [Auriculariopsis ampla]
MPAVETGSDRMSPIVGPRDHPIKPLLDLHSTASRRQCPTHVRHRPPENRHASGGHSRRCPCRPNAGSICLRNQLSIT